MSSVQAQQRFSPALFRSLLEALDPSDVSIKIVTTIALNNMGHARAIVDVIERRMHNVGLESLALRAMWVIIDHLIKAAPLVYGGLLSPHIPVFVERRVAWGSDDALRISFWIQRLVLSWQGLLPNEVWRSIIDSVRQKRTKMLLEYADEQALSALKKSGIDGEEKDAIGEEKVIPEGPRVRTATQKQLESLQASWSELLVSVAAACGVDPQVNSEGGAVKKRRTEMGSSTAGNDNEKSGEGAKDGEAEEDDADFDIGAVDPNAIVFDAHGNPIMALQEIQLPVAARQPRRRR